MDLSTGSNLDEIREMNVEPLAGPRGNGPHL